MPIFRGCHHPGVAPACALTIGNFDGVHQGHQAMLALLRAQARQRGLPSCVLTFEPHPRDHFAAVQRDPSLAPQRVCTLRDKLDDLRRLGIDQTIVLPFDRVCSLPPQEFIDRVLVRGLKARYVLVGDDFRFGSQRMGDYALLDKQGIALGFDVGRMNQYEIHGVRVSSSAVRQALGKGRMDDATRLLGHPYTVSGHVLHGRKLGRELGFPTLNLRFAHWNPAARGVFVVHVHGLGEAPLPGVANLGVRPSLDSRDANRGRVLLETHCLEWPPTLGEKGGYAKLIRVELLHKLHDELSYPSLDALGAGILRDCQDARAFFAQRR
ncbi:bifunctional riboflavin kinase/FAD synthetase [Candidatus Symbiobacter mobilis]|uniref:Riboflavin biosynthesis protein n=1 Tax=Candidatus Symbiobacter mobilis CR TaxID=946483 RepID=U5N8U1_9BURK|nr:bifunctional riboflavin kinase/FAD synthetase [Candidatus Symbiobacter mobilis]AGX86678.1 riboflavin kinase [Candidatus Symbiobacter mobilis CR]